MYKNRENSENRENTLRELKRLNLHLDLADGRVLKNYTNGYVFLSPRLNQIKINAGKSRGKRDYQFSNPEFWVTLSFWKGLKIKALYYLGLKRFI